MEIYDSYIDFFLIWYLWSTFTQNIAPVYLIDYPSCMDWKTQQHINTQKTQIISTNNMPIFWQTTF